MAIIQGFLNINAFIDNALNVTNPIGESTPYCHTASKDPKFYSKNDTTLTVYSRTDVTTVQEASFAAVLSDVMDVLSMMPTIIDDVNGDFTGIELHPLVAGNLDIVSHPDNTDFIFNHMDGNNWPDSLSFRYVKHGAVNWEFKVWFNHDSFIENYLPISFSVLPAIDDIDKYFSNYPAAKIETIANKNLNTYSQRVVNFTGTDVYTGSNLVNLTIVNPNSSSESVDATFTVFHNGFSEVTPDELLNIVMDWIHDNSTNLPADWEDIIPESTVNNIWYVVPMYDQIAVNSPAHSGPLYSSTLNISDLPFDLMMNKYWPNLITERTFGQVKDRTAFLTILYKSAGMILTPDPENADGWSNFKNLYPDYMTINVNDHNINQLVPATRDFIVALDGVFRAADNHTGVDPLPAGMTPATFNGRTYVRKRYARATIMVMTRQSFNT